MKKFIIAPILCILCMAVSAQKLPKINFSQGFLSNHYSLDNTNVKPADIRLHLEKNNAEAYHLWRGADKADNSGVVWSLVGLAGTLVGLAAKEPEIKIAGWSGAAIGWTGALVCTINGATRRNKSISTYNKAAGY